MPSRRRNPALLASIVLAGVAVAILGFALQYAGNAATLPEPDGTPADPTPTASVAAPAPKPAPEPEPEPVAAVLGQVTVEDLSVTGTGLYRAGSSGDAGAALDQSAIDRFRDAILAAVDGHLRDQQVGGPGTLDATGLSGDGEPLRFVGPDERVVAAVVNLRIGARGGPEWAKATLDLQRHDGSAAIAELVFGPGEPPELLAARK